MDKKILVIGILGMFLLLSFSSFSAVGQKVKANEKAVATADGLPDLTIEPIITTTSLAFRVNAIIYNIGTAPLPPHSHFYWEIDVGAITGSQVITVENIDALEPGMSMLAVDTNVFPEALLPSFLKSVYKGHEIKITVDAQSQITELSETNNVYTTTLPNVKSYNSFSPLFSLLSRLSIPVTKNIANIDETPTRAYYFCKIDASGVGDYNRFELIYSMIYLFKGTIKITALFSIDNNWNIRFNDEFTATEDIPGIATLFIGSKTSDPLEVHGSAFCIVVPQSN